MDFFIYALIVMLIVGAGFVLHGSFFGDPAKKDKQDDELMSKISSLESSVIEADEAAASLDDMTKSVFKEFDDKYQALLFLYSLIEDKQKAATQTRPNAKTASQADPIAELASAKKLSINPKYDNIFKMKAAGQSAEEIAKALNMGKGQVSLILSLGGVADA